jgi:flavin reductase (DIM6/NTAB) family NADH-FMN oxidoreductase RutF
MGKISWKGGALLAPVPPVMVTCQSGDIANIITVAWTGILNTVPPKTYISVRPSRFSHKLISESGEFIINLTTAELIKKADFCGIYTGKKVDKFEKCALTKEKAENVGCPMIAESPLSIECRVSQVIPLGTHDMFIADILGVNVKEELIDKSGKLHLENAHLAAFAHGEYFELGKKLGYFGYSVKKKKSPKKRARTE